MSAKSDLDRALDALKQAWNHADTNADFTRGKIKDAIGLVEKAIRDVRRLEASRG